MDLINFTRVTFEVAENGTTTFPVTLSRSGNGIGAVTAQIKLASSTKTGRATVGKDYKHSTVTVTWNDGEIGEKIVDVGIIDDRIAEPIERVNLSFGSIIGAVKGAIATCVVAIQDSTKVTASPEPSKIVDLLQSDYAVRQVRDGFCFNEKFIKPGINLSVTGKDGEILIWHYTIPRSVGSLHSISIAVNGNWVSPNRGIELVGLAIGYDFLNYDLNKSLNYSHGIPKLRPENNTILYSPGYTQSLSGFPLTEIQCVGNITRRYAIDTLLDPLVSINDLSSFRRGENYSAIRIEQGQEFILILDEPLKTDTQDLYLYLAEGSIGQEMLCVYLNPVPKGFSFPPIKPGTTPKYYGL